MNTNEIVLNFRFREQAEKVVLPLVLSGYKVWITQEDPIQEKGSIFLSDCLVHIEEMKK